MGSVMQGLGGKGHTVVGCGGSYRGRSCRGEVGHTGVGHAGVQWVIHGLWWGVEKFH